MSVIVVYLLIKCPKYLIEQVMKIDTNFHLT